MPKLFFQEAQIVVPGPIHLMDPDQANLTFCRRTPKLMGTAVGAAVVQSDLNFKYCRSCWSNAYTYATRNTRS